MKKKTPPAVKLLPALLLAALAAAAPARISAGGAEDLFGGPFPGLPPFLTQTAPAYPSGYSAVARVFGLMLSELVPANSAKYTSYADQAALNRVIGGVHHPSDTEAGKKLGNAVYKALERDRAFKTDMQTLRGNLKP